MRRGSITRTSVWIAVICLAAAGRVCFGGTGRWQAVPMVDRSLREAGYAGGEGGQWINCIATGGRDGKCVLMGNDVGGVYRSLDAGRTWTPATVGLDTRGALAIAFFPRHPDRALLVGTAGKSSGLFLSDDAGASWRQVLKKRQRLAHDYRTQIGFVPGTDRVYWATADDGLYRSEDGTSQWVRVQGGDVAAGSHFAVDAQGNLLAGTARGLMLSRDGGGTWRNVLDKPITGVCAPTSGPGAGRILALASHELYAAATDTYRFSRAPGTLPRSLANNFCHLALSPHDPDRMLLQDDTMTAGRSWEWPCYLTEDGGRTWRTCLFDPKKNHWTPVNGRPRLFAFSPVDPLRVHSFTSDLIFLSEDGGRNFHCESAGYNAILIASETLFNVNDPSLIAVPAQDYNGAISDDNGRTWRYVNWSGLHWGGHTYGAYRLSRETAVAGVSAHWRHKKGNVIRLAVTHDGGETVTRTDHVIAGVPVGCGAKGDPQRVFLGEWLSRDGAQTWERMNGCTGVMFCDFRTGLLLGVGADGRSIVQSTDNGETWRTVLDRRKANAPPSSLAYDRETKRIYFSRWSWDLSAFVADPATTAPPVETVLPGERHVCSVAVDPIDPAVVYVACHADDLYTMENVWRSTDHGRTWRGLCRKKGDGKSGPDGANQAIHVTVNPVTREPFVFTHCNGVWRYSQETKRCQYEN